MALFESKDGKELVLLCKCGCDEGIRIRVEEDEDVFYQTYLSGNWYKEQAGLGKKLKKIWAILRNKDFYYSEIVMDRQEWEQYKAWIQEK